MWRWGWVSRELYEALEARAKWADDQLRATEEMLTISRVDADIRVRAAQDDATTARSESKLLIDRIVQMSGQPPIFSPAPTVATPPPAAAPEPPPPTSTLPPPETRATFNDVHRAARQAIKDGTFNTLSGAN